MLPVEEIFPDLFNQLQQGDAIVVAPPGAGKSTRLPLALLQREQFKNQKIIMLQPRRMAARSIATYLSLQLNEALGETVGYRIRGESKIGKFTRLEIVTEGILTRMIQSDPELSGIGLIIFDEFHERSLNADFSLALALEIQEAFNEQLRLLVMSASLDANDVQKIMPCAKILQSQGRSFPVNIEYRPIQQKNLSLLEHVRSVIQEAYEKHTKDILVFLPGVFEINKLTQMFIAYRDDLIVLPLHANLKKHSQFEALKPADKGMRKLILSTNIAETSLTIDGIEVVIDSGVEKSSRFDLRLGLTQLFTQKISQASAQQRAGRAGRLMAGTCYRLWSEELHYRLAKQHPAEILNSDIAGLLLEAKVWGSDFSHLRLIDQPSAPQQAQALDHLRYLGAVDTADNLSELGKNVHLLGTEPALAVMLLKAKSLSLAHLSLACALCALLEAKDPLFKAPNPWLEDRLHFLLANRQHELWRQIKQWHHKFGIHQQDWPFEDLAVIIGLGFPLWIAKKRNNHQYTMANGSGAQLTTSDNEDSSLNAADWLAIANLQIVGTDSNRALIRYAQVLSKEQVSLYFNEYFKSEETLLWDEEKQKISVIEQQFFAAIKVAKLPKEITKSHDLASLWHSLLQKRGLSFVPLNEKARNFIQRVNMLASIDEDIPSFSEEYLLSNVEQWLLPSLADQVSFKSLSQLPLLGLLKSLLSYEQQQKVERLLPLNFDLPSGRTAKLQYKANNTILMSVRMQDLFGLNQHPSVMNGKMPILCEILSPAQRPIQTTMDLPRFWRGSYVDVKKEMKGRYPKHYWPDDPTKI